MVLLNDSRWGAVVPAIVVFAAIVFAVDVYGEYPSYVVSTLVIIACGLLLLVWCSVFSFRVMSYVIIFLPALAPAYAFIVREKGLFSAAAKHLQTDPVLIDKAVFLFGVAAVVYVVVAVLSSSERCMQEETQSTVVGKTNKKFLLVVAAMTIVSAFAIESGPTIITASYEEVLSGRPDPGPLAVFFKLMFGGFWGMLFVYGRQHKRLFWGVTIIVFLWLFLHVRRVEVFGMILPLVLWKQYSIKRTTLAALLLLFVCSQAFVGQVRHHSVVEYIQGAEDVSIVKSLREGGGYAPKAAIPGGLSNVFLSCLHLVNEKDSGNLSKDQVFTMLQWPNSIVPNTIWKAFGMRPIKNEHELIYEDLKLQYVGGMHLLGVFYLNGGVLFVVFYGLLHGVLARKVDFLIKKHCYLDVVHRGSLTLLAATVFLVYQFRYHWYNPQTMFKAVAYSVVVFLIINVLVKWSGAKLFSEESG